MAFRLKHWLGVVALSLALMAAWRLPLDTVRPGNAITLSEEAARARDLSSELRLARTTLDQVRRANRLPGQVLGDDGASVSVHIPEDQRVTPQERARLSALVRGEVAGPDPRMRVAYAFDTGTADERVLLVSQPSRVEAYLGDDAGTPYCVLVIVTRPTLVSALVRDDLAGHGWNRWTRSLLGPCVFYAEHGAAGPRIQEWLDAGGVNFAFGRRDAESPQFQRPIRRSFLGSGVFQDRGTLEVELCLAGAPEACESAFLAPLAGDPWARARSPSGIRSPAFFAGTARNGPFPAENGFLLDDLESEFGSEAFARFWTSDDDVRTAFETAFGIDLGAWLVGWLDDGPGIEPATPAPTRAATLGGLLTIALMTGLATAWQRRRQVA